MRPVKPSNHKRVVPVGINHDSMFSMIFVENSSCTENIKDSPSASLVVLPEGSRCCFFGLALATAFSLKVICLTAVFTYMYLTTGRGVVVPDICWDILVMAMLAALIARFILSVSCVICELVMLGKMILAANSICPRIL